MSPVFVENLVFGMYIVLSGPVLWTALGLETGPDQDRGPGPFDLLDERPVKTGLGPIQDSNRVDLIFL